MFEAERAVSLDFEKVDDHSSDSSSAFGAISLPFAFLLQQSYEEEGEWDSQGTLLVIRCTDIQLEHISLEHIWYYK